jgi:hypothetical protein
MGSPNYAMGLLLLTKSAVEHSLHKHAEEQGLCEFAWNAKALSIWLHDGETLILKAEN